MRSTLNYKTIKLQDAIVPQVFIKKDENIIYYDRINSDEGRFCISSLDGILNSFEVLAGQGMITYDGDMYVSKARDNTVLIKYSKYQKIEKSIELEGIFFDFKQSYFNELICLGNLNGKTVVKILNNDLEQLRTIYPKDIFFGCSLYIEKEYIYIAGFDIHNDFIIIKTNYIGAVLEKWNIGLSDNKKIISKMQKYKDYFILLFTNGNESLMFFNYKDNSIKEIFPFDFNVESFSDFNIEKDTLSILGEKYIFDISIIEILEYKSRRRIRGFKIDGDIYSYVYVAFCRIFSKNIILCIKYATPLLFLTYLFFLLKFDILRLKIDYIFYLPIIVFISSIILSFKYLIIKQNRIEQFLYIKHQKDFKCINIFPFYMGFTAACIIQLINKNFLYSSVLGVFVFLLFFLINKSVINHIQNENNSIIIELLKFEDFYIKEYIDEVLKRLREKNSEKLLIEFVTDNNANKSVLLRWQNSRKSIIKTDIKILDNSNKIETILDFSKRDIKYSRFSILMDYLCYIKNQTKVKEIEIEVLDKDS
ncbi:hypothetical protein SAMN05443428_11145 [Caloramator quimbayensis]|uniref:Uncharacterized protein n=1 Tax=Caloramator quimbayensis TaxID=1147123 RepID=A0A1T4XP42_9CLOT|nr:hypothetical protein [Caloramator quimbayensis]SKA91297.1 hypothetical protein SAMN05443428_11145 [Caloramator quimbayensis]